MASQVKPTMSRPYLAVNMRGTYTMEPQRLGISTRKPKSPQYAIMSKRLDSYQSWPDYLPMSPNDLAEAGFVYTGVGDYVRCYHCGGGLRNWEMGDRPWVEHVEWYPKCGHIMLVKGQTGPEKNKDPMKSIAVQRCRKMGINEYDIKQAVYLYIYRNGHSNFETSDLTTIASDLEIDTDGPESHVEAEDPETLRQLEEENTRLKESMKCKICHDDIANIVFLPCGHRISCPMCAPAIVKCNICSVAVNGYVKAILA